MEDKELHTARNYTRTTSDVTWCYVVTIVLAIMKAFG